MQTARNNFATWLHKLLYYLCGCFNSRIQNFMSRVVKNTKFVLILLTGLVILLHATIPHHHHLDTSCDHNSTNSTTNQSRGESSTEADKHCHALNTIVIQKVNSITFDNKTAFNSLLLFITSNEEVKFHNKVSLTFHTIKDLVVLKQYLSSEPSFRGPPALV